MLILNKKILKYLVAVQCKIIKILSPAASDLQICKELIILFLEKNV